MTLNQRRRERLKRRAPHIKTAGHLRKIIASFPVGDQQAALNDAAPLLNIPGLVIDETSLVIPEPQPPTGGGGSQEG